MSSTPIELRVNMSLEDIAKANKANQAKKKTAKATKGGKKAAATTAGKPKVGGKKKAATAGANAKTAQNQAKAVGKTKANRAAQINQKRGLSATAKASPKQVKAMTKKQLVVNKKLAPKGGAKKKPIANASLKISFNTAQVRQNTDKNMVAQLMGALSKGSAAGNKNNATTKPKPKPKQPPIIKQPFKR